MSTIQPLEQELPAMLGLLVSVLALHRTAEQEGEP